MSNSQSMPHQAHPLPPTPRPGNRRKGCQLLRKSTPASKPSPFAPSRAPNSPILPPAPLAPCVHPPQDWAVWRSNGRGPH